MDEVIKQLILENKLTLTLLAMVFTPVGLWAGWRRLARDPGAGQGGDREAAARLAAVECTLGALVAEVARLREQQERLAAASDRERLPTPRHPAPARVITPH